MTGTIIIGSVVVLIIIMSYFRNMQAKKKVVHVAIDNCIGCLLCLKKCRHKAIAVSNNEKGRHVLIDTAKCTACGDCISACKFDALQMADRKK